MVKEKDIKYGSSSLKPLDSIKLLKRFWKDAYDQGQYNGLQIEEERGTREIKKIKKTILKAFHLGLSISQIALIVDLSE